VTGELWSERVMLYFVEAEVEGAWSRPENIQSVVIDDTQGVIFEATLVDINMDGKEIVYNIQVALGLGYIQ
jgi:hypothetical protein